MDKIEIQNVCPNVFADFKELRSDVWKTFALNVAKHI